MNFFRRTASDPLAHDFARTVRAYEAAVRWGLHDSAALFYARLEAMGAALSRAGVWVNRGGNSAHRVDGYSGEDMGF